MFKRLFVLSLLAVLVSSASFSIKAPAVDSSGNGVISLITVQVVNGSGMVYTNIENSLITSDTENSMRTAAQVGASYAGVEFNNYNYYFDIQSNASKIDGPSAGLAFTLGVIQDFFIIQNSSKTFRTDFTVTGTINADGSVGVVGGVSDKLLAASGVVNLMLIPSGQSLFDGVDYVGFGSGLNKPVQVVEVSNVSSAVKLLLTPTGSFVNGVPLHSLTVLSPVPFNFSNSTLPMKTIALMQIQSAEQKLARIPVSNITAILNETLNQALNLTERGYFYTAANSAFLAENEIETIILGNVSSSDFQVMIENLSREMSGFNFTRMNSNNFEWVAGGELRYFWALEELNQLNNSFSVLQTPSYFISDFVTAKDWFEAAVDLNGIASNISGDNVSEFNVRPHALSVLNQSFVFENSSGNAFFHQTAALMEFNAGDYVASSMDSMFVFAYSNNSMNFNSTYPSVWAEVYHAQGFYNKQFYNLTGSQDSESNFVFLSLLSGLLKGNAGMAVQSFSNPLQVSASASQQNKTIQVSTIASYTPLVDFNYLWIGVVAILIVLIFLVSLVLSSKTERKPEEIIDKLDVALAEGRISEKTHERLVKKWGEKIKNKRLILKVKRKG